MSPECIVFNILFTIVMVFASIGIFFGLIGTMLNLNRPLYFLSFLGILIISGLVYFPIITSDPDKMFCSYAETHKGKK